MPIREYRCEKCEKIIELLVSHSESEPESCTECAGRLERLISSSTFQLLGSGWFKTGGY